MASQAQVIQQKVDRFMAQLSKYPALNRFDKHLPVPKSYIAVTGLAILTITPKPQDDIQWLTYWVVFGFFNFVETFVSFVLYWFPFYYTFKTLAIVWLMLPQTQGAKIVYHRVLRPAFLSMTGSSPASRVPASAADINKTGFSASSTGVHTE
ncbi:Protein YOP1 [Malassezia restricta CBS 7877]|uniref:Protein YOP1 n=1 Tax=Malassezia restricta (strain ATCC 96810 / NBRC 103918 / CBS 7877) TaxID=425264 RepID=A0A3G2SBS4_MALR7|nr:Protein YOP1 [Malassezia restricta CBS 7877]